MPRVNPLQPAFNVGEMSERLHSRLDFQKYPNGLETCVNMIPLAEGPLMRRSGTRYIAATQSASVKGRLKRFQFSTTQAYMVEMGAAIMRFYRHQGQITVATTTATVTNGTFTSNITDWDDVSVGGGAIAHDSTNGRLSLDPGGTAGSDIAAAEQDITTGTTGTEHVVSFRVIGAPGDKIRVRVGTATTNQATLSEVDCEVGYHAIAFTPTTSPFYLGFWAYGSDQDKIVQIDDVSILSNTAVQIATPYAAADLFQIEGPQSADVLYLFHPSYPTYKLQRLGHTTWQLVEVAWQDGPWMAINEGVTLNTLTPSATTGTGATVTAASTSGINDGDGFTSTDVGRLVRIDNPASGVDWGWGIIVAVTNTTTVTVDIKRDFSTTNADVRWRLGAWSGTTGYPSCGAFYQQRLLAANTSNQPQTWWGSNTGDFETMSPDSANSSAAWDGTVEDDDSLDYTISADNVNAIRWMSPGKGTLVIGTVGGEWSVSSTGAVITPTDVVVDPETSHGSANIAPLRIGNTVLFVQRASRKVREFAFSFEVDGYQALDMTRLAEHVTRGGIVEMDYAEEPNALVWAVRADGQLLSMTFRREEDVVGWARHIIGGSWNGANAVVESVAVIPGAAGAGQVQSSADRDEVWLIVKRSVNGATKRYIEVLECDWDSGYAQEDAYYADSLITYDGAAATVITGLSHLEGETVKVLADGYVVADATVASGQITLGNSASVVQVGLGYTHTAKTLKVTSGTARGTPVGQTKLISGVTFAVANAATLGFGPTTAKLRTVDFRTVADLTDTAVAYMTTEYYVGWDDDWKTDPRIIVQESSPTPFMLAGLVPEIDVRETRG